MVSPAVIRRVTLSLDSSRDSCDSCLGRGQAGYEFVPSHFALPRPPPSGHLPLPVQDVTDMGGRTDGQQQCPGLQGSTDQAMQAGGDSRDCGAAHTPGPAENTFQAGEARNQVLEAQRGRRRAQVSSAGLVF